MDGDTLRPIDGDSIAVLGTEDARHAARPDCFADEVVIDFPSVAPAIERMRHAFVAEEPAAALRAEIGLSARQASDGIIVPLSVPVRITCRRCGGRGETWSDPCRTCEGRGTEMLRHKVQVTLPAGVTDGACFRFHVATRHDPPTRIELHIVVQ